ELLPAAWAGIAMGMGVLGGHPQVYYYAALAVTIHALFWTVAGWREAGSRRERLRPMVHLIVLGTVTLGISAVQTVPSFSNAVASVHATAGAEFKWLNPLAFYQLTMFVIPWGLDAVQDWGILVSERYAYMGWVTLIFGLGALIWRREARTSVYAVIAGIGLVLAMGENGFLFKFFFDNVPGYGMFRYPSRVLVLVAFGLTVLAGLGLDRYLSEEDGRGARRSLPRLLRTLALGGLAVWVLAIGSLTASVGSGVHDMLVHFVSQLSLALVVVWLWWGVVVMGRERAAGAGFTVGLTAVVLFDLWSPGSIGARVPSPDRLTSEEKTAVAFLNERKLAGELFRIENHVLRESLLQRHAISSFNTESRLMDGGYLELIWAAGDNPRILDLLNVRYVVGFRSPGERGGRPVRDGLYRNLDLGPHGLKRLDLGGRPVRTGRVELVSKIRYGGHVPQGETVAEMEVWETTGKRHRFPIRAGIETADWAAGSPKAGARHGLARIEDSWVVENKDEKYEGHSYRATLARDRPEQVRAGPGVPGPGGQGHRGSRGDEAGAPVVRSGTGRASFQGRSAPSERGQAGRGRRRGEGQVVFVLEGPDRSGDPGAAVPHSLGHVPPLVAGEDRREEGGGPESRSGPEGRRRPRGEACRRVHHGPRELLLGSRAYAGHAAQRRRGGASVPEKARGLRAAGLIPPIPDHPR
ncbi:MAG: YfhO family protein, partial [Nitrospirae bacterium]|nr:YfhO family protein [Nitrospirota bacterium]